MVYLVINERNGIFIDPVLSSPSLSDECSVFLDGTLVCGGKDFKGENSKKKKNFIFHILLCPFKQQKVGIFLKLKMSIFSHVALSQEKWAVLRCRGRR